MITIKEAVIVEGKYDKIRLSSLLDTLIIPTDGFAIFKDKAKLSMIKTLAETRGILILTDSDGAGFVIRNHLCGCIDAKYIKQAYIPDVKGKERRKAEASKEGLLGVEGMSTQVLLEALAAAGVAIESKKELKFNTSVTKSDFFEDGLSGSSNSKERRLTLQKELKLPKYLSQNSLLMVINTIMSYDEYKELIKRLF
ncbi:MAG: DUF4093 domain-containing protein [Oscillospiraceae bacterium]|jgi:ribonuclease M5|nr:DUF4093 domain-containing protein [Oscillospiraceae bacterium]